MVVLCVDGHGGGSWFWVMPVAAINPIKGLKSRWGLSFGLCVLTVCLHHVSLGFGQHPHLNELTWCLLPSLIGSTLLGPLQELLVVLSFYLLIVGDRLVGWNDPLTVGVDQLLPLFSDQALHLMVIVVLVWSAALGRQDKRLNRRLQQHTDELKRQLAHSLQYAFCAHEIRQPLAQFLLKGRFLLHQMEAADVDLEQQPWRLSLEQLLQAGQQIDMAVQSILRLSRGSRVDAGCWDLVLLVHKVVNDFLGTRTLLNINLRINLPSSPLMVDLDRQQIDLALRNLLNNAHDALRLCDPANRRLIVNLVAGQGFLHLQVADSGLGTTCLNYEDLAFLTSKPEGVGLGLVIVQAIAVANGGRLMAGNSSELGGAEFVLHLPWFRTQPGTSSDTEWQGEPASHR